MDLIFSLYEFQTSLLYLFMETLKIDIQTEQEKKVLLAFLDSLDYHYRADKDDYTLTNEQLKELLKRKSDFESGNTTSKAWTEIKQRYEGV